MPRFLAKLASFFALLGMVVAVGIAAMTLWSIVQRTLTSRPIQGDIELTQVGIALAISLCIPWAQWRSANIIVDFFTQKCAAGTRRKLDGVGAFLLALMYALLAWRTAAGALSSFDAKETTMILGLPNYWSYISLAPGLALAAVIAAWQACAHFRNQSLPNAEAHV